MLDEEKGYQGGFPEWVMLRVYQGLILKGVLQGILFKAGAGCRDYDEFQRLMGDYRKLQGSILKSLEGFTGPGRLGQSLLRLADKSSVVGIPIKYFTYRMHGREFIKPIKRFVEKWMNPQARSGGRLDILITGEGYMRLAQAEQIFGFLLGEIGFQRFNLQVSPVLSYLEILLEEAEEKCRTELQMIRARQLRTGNNKKDSRLRSNEKRKLRKTRLIRFILRRVLARPLYRASGLHLPPAVNEVIEASRTLLPTYRPLGELSPYVGEALVELRDGADIVLNVAPNGCMVSTMGEVLTPSIMHADGVESGRIQTLLSAEGDVDEEALSLAVLKAMGPQRYYQVDKQALA